MRKLKLLTAMALDSNSFWPIDLGLISLSSVILQCRTSKDIYLSNDPLGLNYFTLKAGTSISVDLDGGVLDVSNGPELVTNGAFLANVNAWTFNADDWTYQVGSGDIDHDANGVSPLSQSFATIAGGHYRIGYKISDQSVAGVSVTLGGTPGLTRLEAGTYIDYLLVGGISGGIVFTPQNTSRFTLDDISVKRVTFPGNSSPIYVKGSEDGLYLEIIAVQ